MPKKEPSALWRIAKRLLLWATLGGLVLGALGGILVAGLVHQCAGDLPSMDPLYAWKPELTTVVVDRHGVSLGDIGVVKRTQISYKALPKLIVQSILSVEDKAFWEHAGVNWRGFARAMLVNARAMHFVQGGSTITQQVVKKFLLSGDKSLLSGPIRKIKEMLLAQQLEKRLTSELGSKRAAKERIMELYLNRISYGDEHYGIQAAAQYYFGHDAIEIGDPEDPADVAEVALLVGIPQDPTHLALRHPNNLPKVLKRRKTVLKRMLTDRLISEEVWQHVSDDADLHLKQSQPSKAPEAVDEAINWSLCQELRKPGTPARLDAPIDDPKCQRIQREASPETRKKAWESLNRKGTVIQTTISGHLQAIARYAVESGLARLETAHPGAIGNGLQSAAVVLNPQGEVLAMVGRNAYRPGNENIVIRGQRQPGSTFKPFVYAAAIQNKTITMATQIKDKEICYKIWAGQPLWCPKNYEPEFEGWVNPRKALDMSINTVAAQVGVAVGVEGLVNFARTVGIEGNFSGAGPAIALGAFSASPLRMATGYATFASGGKRVQPFLITAVGGSKIERAPAPQAIYPELAAVMTSMLQGVIDDPHGTGHAAAKLGIPSAGKTGTTSSGRDAWFSGYTPDVIVVVWVGYQDNRPLWKKATGASVALPIWMDIVKQLYEGRKAPAFIEPQGVTYADMDLDTGKPSEEDKAVEVAFLPGTDFSTVPMLGEPDPVGTPTTEEPAAGTEEAAPQEEEAPAEEEPPAAQQDP